MTTKKTAEPAKPVGLKAFREELIASIQNEKRNFNMARFMKGGEGKVATCKTAMCMAGHIEALRPQRAKELFKTLIGHEDVAARIWMEETGQRCRLDFFADAYAGPSRDETFDGQYSQTREEAVAHIRGRSKTWPLLEPQRANSLYGDE